MADGHTLTPHGPHPYRDNDPGNLRYFGKEQTILAAGRGANGATALTTATALFRGSGVGDGSWAQWRACQETLMTDPAPQPSNGKTALTDDLRSHFGGDAPIADKARSFAKARPWTAAAFVAGAAAVVLGTLRGNRG